MAALARCAGATLKQYAAGATLIEAGERDFKFFVVVSSCGSRGPSRACASIGAAPRVDWLPAEIDKDAKGVVRTGPAARSARWPAGRDPYVLETSRPGVLAAGDVRSGSVKRVASAVGEGAMAIMFVHQSLKEM
jgi:NADPH-dependent glutamate synthase beta subunit-like oxidoreductase